MIRFDPRHATVFTTGNVAKLCRVAPRTVSKWFDTGALVGYRIPGSQDRRIGRVNLIRFMEKTGMPTHELGEEAVFHRVHLIGFDGHVAKRIENVSARHSRCETSNSILGGAFAAGFSSPDVVIVSDAVGRADMMRFAGHVRGKEWFRCPFLVCTLGDDEQDTAPYFAAGRGYDEVFRSPFSPADIAECTRLLMWTIFPTAEKPDIQPVAGAVAKRLQGEL